MLDLAFMLVLTAWSLGFGLWILERFRAVPEALIDAAGLATSVGLGSLALAVLALGECHQLGRGGVLAVLSFGAVLGIPAIARLRLSGLSRERNAETRLDLLDRALLGLFLLTFIGTLLTSLAPVTDGDALCYHLQVPKVMLWEGRVFFDPDLHETVYPLVTELLYAVGLMFRGPVACRLIQWVLGLVFAANVTALARTSLGVRAWWAGVFVLLVPAISNGMTAPLNDVALAAFGSSALVAWLRNCDRPSWVSSLLAGGCLGMALGVKYPALVLAGVLSLAFLAQAVQGTRPIKLSVWDFSVFVAAAVVVGGPWYLRAYLATGNPVFPYFRQVFGGAGLDEVLDVSRRAMPVTPWNILTVLSRMTLEPDRFDSFSHQFGPIFLLFLPALLLERAPRRLLGLTAVGLAYMLLCTTQRQSMRFVLVSLGPMAVGVAWLVDVWWRRRSLPSLAMVAVLMLSLGFETSLALARVRHGLPVIMGRETASDYLSQREPTYPVGNWIDSHLPADARLIGQDHRGFYLPRPYAMELAHRRRTSLGRNQETAREVAETLAGEGFTHLLLCPPVPETAVEFDPTLGRIMADWLETHEPVYRRDLKDADGVLRRYAIYELRTPTLAARSGGLRR
ncbi:ArnT family glycosyltransferase [Singulisphaera sp. PoT]|uniref:ArnT family glycosyltransferase n=1 Tax=Singulisphaera sp. PoT TaxID=3411797 RepID=UPI003BF5D072